MADTSTVQDIDMWIKRIEDMQSLKLEKVIPGHYTKNDTSPESLNFVKQYLIDYKNAAVAHKDSAGIISVMAKKYPGLPGQEPIEFGAKVFTDGSPWHITSTYPPIDKTAEVNFDGTVFELHFKDNRIMSFEGTSGAFKGVKDTVKYTAFKSVGMSSWSTGGSLTRVPMLFMYRSGIQERPIPIFPRNMVRSPILRERSRSSNTIIGNGKRRLCFPL